MRSIKKVVRILAILIACVIFLNIALFLLFSIPAVQKRAADFAIAQLKPRLETEISIDKIRIKLFNTVQIEGLYVEDREKDTLLYVGELATRINFWNLLNNELSISSVRLDDFTANVYRETPDSAFNFQFIIDAFASTDTVWKEPVKDPLKIALEDVKISRGTLRYDVRSVPETPGRFNPDHLFVTGFGLHAALPSLNTERLVADVNKLTFTERKSGIRVNDFQGAVRSEGSELTGKRIALSLNNSRLEVAEALYDTRSKAFLLRAASEVIDPGDAVLFFDPLGALSKPIAFDVDLAGKLPQAEIKKLAVEYGDETFFSLNGAISDFSKYDEASIRFNIPGFKLDVSDLHDFIRIGVPDFEMLPPLEALENIDLKLQAEGKLGNFNLTARINTAPGNISFEGKGRADSLFENIAVGGTLATRNLNVGRIIGEESGVGMLSLSTFADVSIRKNEPLGISADGTIGSMVYKGYTYRNVALNGLYSGNNISAGLFMDSSDNQFDLKADLRLGNPMKFDVRGTVDKLFLAPLFALETWENPFLTARINGKLEGSGVDELVGNVVIDSTSLYDDKFIYNPGPIYLQALPADSAGERKIQIFSSIFEGEVLGDYRFSTLGAELTGLLNRQLPTLTDAPPVKVEGKETNSFRFDFLLKNTEDLSYALSLPFINVEPATIKGTVDLSNTGSIALHANIPRLMFGQSDVRGSKLDLSWKPDKGILLEADTYLVLEEGYVNARLRTDAGNDSVSNRLSFRVNNSVAQADGKLNVSLGFGRNAENDLVSNISIHPTSVLFNGKSVDIMPSTVVLQKDRIAVKEFEMRENGMLLLGIDGVASKKREDAVRAFFNNTEVETILAAFNIFNFKGAINGGVVVNQALADPMIQTDNFRIENIRTHTDTIGVLAVEGDWDVVKKGLSLNAELRHNGDNYLRVDGFIPTGSNSPMDVDIAINRLPLAWVQPFAVSAFSRLSGTINSRINLSGQPDAPVTQGWLGVTDGVMTVAFTNVTYKISDTINISPKNIGFNNLVIRDDNNREARLNLSLNHSNFDGISYNAGIEMNDFLLLNNEKRTDQIAYGTLRLSGNMSINGSSSGIFGTANLRNESRSNIMIELPQTAQANRYSGIIYINTPEEADSLSFLRKKKETDTQLNTRLNSGMLMNIQATLNLNPMLKAGVIINPTTGDLLEINGTGQIRVNFDSRANPPIRLYGDYVAQEGKFQYKFQGLQTIDFNIRQGSTVTLVGDPLNTQFNITAYNQVNADLVTLSEEFRTQLANTRTAVDATLQIRGNLEQMNLKYGIELPEVSNDVRQRLNSLISTDEQKNRQFAGLILTGGFIPAEGSMNTGSGGSRAATFAAGQISKGLDGLLAGVLNDNWSINTNLQSRDGSLDNVRMGLDVSTRLLDDRLRISTNLTYGDNSTLASQQAFMGEFELEYDINNWLMIRAYNRANQRFEKRASTTQGTGIVVTKDARKFKNLFKFSFRKKKNQ